MGDFTGPSNPGWDLTTRQLGVVISHRRESCARLSLGQPGAATPSLRLCYFHDLVPNMSLYYTQKYRYICVCVIVALFVNVIGFVVDAVAEAVAVAISANVAVAAAVAASVAASVVSLLLSLLLLLLLLME